MIITINLPLPFRIPLEDGLGLVSSYSFGDFRARFYKQDVSVQRQGFPETKASYTTVQLDIHPKADFLQQIEGHESDSGLYTSFVTGLDYINRVLDAFRSVIGDAPYIRNITVADLPFAVVIEVDGNAYVYVTGHLEDGRELGPDLTAAVGHRIGQWDAYPEIMIQDRFFESAKTYLFREQFIDAVVDLQTSFEVFIRNMHRFILRRLQAKDAEITRLSEIPFRNVIEQHLARHLGVCMSFDQPGPIKDWYDALYVPRNQIVHHGRTMVSRSEADKAYEVYVKARNYVSDALFFKGFTSEKGSIDLTVLRPTTKDPRLEAEVLHHLKRVGFVKDDEDGTQ